jgi:LPXTG-motif cell wall-anchored protein
VQIFYLQLIVLGVLAPIFVGCLPSIPKQPDIPFLAKLRSIDWLGTLLLTAVLTSFTIAITSGGTVYAWSSARTIVALVLSAILTIIFCVTQYKLIGTTSLERLFPMSPLWSGQLVSLAVAAALASSALLISIYYIPVHFLFVHADPARGAALRVIPFVSFWWWLLVVCAILLPKTGHHGLWYLLTGLCLTAGGAAMYTVRSWTSPAAIGGYMVLYLLGFLTSEAQGGIGTGIIAASKASDHEKETEAELDEVIQAETEDMTRFFGFAQALGGVVGLTVASAVFQNSAFSGLSKTLRDQNLTRRQVQSAVFGVRSEIWKSQPDAQSKAQFLDTLVKRIDNVWMLVVITGCLYTACAYCLLSLKSFLPKGMLRLRMRF